MSELIQDIKDDKDLIRSYNLCSLRSVNCVLIKQRSNFYDRDEAYKDCDE